MNDQEKNLATFQNLCVIAHADGVIHENELALLAELAGSMGIDHEKAEKLMDHGAQLAFIIPDSEQERLMEMRMVVLMMVADGKIHDREYKGCLALAAQMGIEKAYLDEVIEVYKKQHQEQIRHLAIFQNLYLMAAIDEVIDPAEAEFLQEVAFKLGLGQQDIDYILENPEKLELVLPEEEEERYYSLKNLVYMMIIDGIIDEREYALCLTFAEQIGLKDTDIEAILDEYEQLRKQREAEQSEVDNYNIDVYLDAYNAFSAIPVPVKEKVMAIEDAFMDTNYKMGPSDKENRAFYDFLWLMYVRGVGINRKAIQMIPIHLDFVRNKGNFKGLLDYLIENEQEYGATQIPLAEMDFETVKKEVSEFFARMA